MSKHNKKAPKQAKTTKRPLEISANKENSVSFSLRPKNVNQHVPEKTPRKHSQNVSSTEEVLQVVEGNGHNTLDTAQKQTTPVFNGFRFPTLSEKVFQEKLSKHSSLQAKYIQYYSKLISKHYHIADVQQLILSKATDIEIGALLRSHQEFIKIFPHHELISIAKNNAMQALENYWEKLRELNYENFEILKMSLSADGKNNLKAAATYTETLMQQGISRDLIYSVVSQNLGHQKLKIVLDNSLKANKTAEPQYNSQGGEIVSDEVIKDTGLPLKSSNLNKRPQSAVIPNTHELKEEVKSNGNLEHSTLNLASLPKKSKEIFYDFHEKLSKYLNEQQILEILQLYSAPIILKFLNANITTLLEKGYSIDDIVGSVKSFRGFQKLKEECRVSAAKESLSNGYSCHGFLRSPSALTQTESFVVNREEFAIFQSMLAGLPPPYPM